MMMLEDHERGGVGGGQDTVLMFEGSPAEIDGLIADLTKDIGDFSRLSAEAESTCRHRNNNENGGVGNTLTFDVWFERASRARWNEATAAIRGHLIGQFAEAVRACRLDDDHYWNVPKELVDPGELETARAVTEKQVIEPTLQDLAATRAEAQEKRTNVARSRGALDEALYRLRAMAQASAGRDPALASNVRETIELLQQLYLTERSNWEDWTRWRNRQRETYRIGLLALEIIGRTLSKRLAGHLERVCRLHTQFLQRLEAEYGERLKKMRDQQQRMAKVWDLLKRRIDHAINRVHDDDGEKGENWALEALLKECEMPEHDEHVNGGDTLIPVLDVAVQEALEPWPGVLAKLRSTDEWLNALSNGGEKKKADLQRQVNVFERTVRQAMDDGWIPLETAYRGETIAYRQRLSAIMDRLLTRTRQSNERVTMRLWQKMDGRLERANLDRTEQLRARETRRSKIDSRLAELSLSGQMVGNLELQRLAGEWRQRLDIMVRDLLSLLERAETVRCLKTLFLNRG